MARLREFDQSDVLEEILILFWNYGSLDLSLDQISKQLNLSKTSLYSAFGNKDDLVNKCLDLYYTKYDLELIKSFKGSTITIATQNLLSFAEERFMNKKLPRGCFMINCLIEKNRISTKIQHHLQKITDKFFMLMKEEAAKKYKLNDKKMTAFLRFVSISLYGLAIDSHFNLSSSENYVQQSQRFFEKNK